MDVVNKLVILQMCIILALSKQHIIQITPKLRQLGYHRNIDLGEVIVEGMINNSRACGRLCEQNSACHSVMLVGNHCRLFHMSQCPVSMNYYTQYINAFICNHCFIIIIAS